MWLVASCCVAASCVCAFTHLFICSTLQGTFQLFFSALNVDVKIGLFVNLNFQILHFLDVSELEELLVNGVFHKFVLNDELFNFAGALMRVVLCVEVIRHLRVKRSILCRSLFYEVWRLRWCFKPLRAGFLSNQQLLLLRHETNPLSAHAVLWMCSWYHTWLIRLSAAGEPLTICDATTFFLACVVVDLQQLLRNAWHLASRRNSCGIISGKRYRISNSILLIDQTTPLALVILDSLIQARLKVIRIWNRYPTTFERSARIQLRCIPFLIAIGCHLYF